ncbi:MAG: hypothetical protein CBC35_10425 [Planctomycetes bacterium TMED75]|nr:hypothetical protein [Planctomycetaceae bacterium]OUU91065.1 MAG: hypothetical protein CBC35_10425 [Planctomycetes bacterium TMED75]
MDFVAFEEAWRNITPLNIVKLEQSTEEELRPGFEDSDQLSIFDLIGRTPDADSQNLELDTDRAADALEAVLHKLHLAPVFLFPIGTWRHVFDAITFDLVENEEWQEIETAATIELNTHDPLMCGPGDLHTVHDVLSSVLKSGKTPDQGVTIAALGKPILIVAEPAERLRIEIMGDTLAQEVQELLQPFLKQG